MTNTKSTAPSDLAYRVDVADGETVWHLLVDAFGNPWIEGLTVWGQRMELAEGTGHGRAAREVYALWTERCVEAAERRAEGDR